ncbi:hypothetical protein KRX57_04850 [Weeksellaceae bacterium TAE3-ERU29]|nr:hypothetical protein [Weeksellaceae bacterium TAE3-ERU29]
MKREKIDSFSATLNFGLKRAYSEDIINKEEVISYLKKLQKNLIEKEGISLSCAVSETEIVCNEWREEHLQLHFLNYPKFKGEHKIIKSHFEELIEKLMREFEQNRVIIEYKDEMIELYKSKKIDKGIFR